MIPMPQITHLLKDEAVLWAGRPGLWRSLTPGDLAGWIMAIAAVCGAAYFYLDHTALSAAYAETAFEDAVAMDRSQYRWIVFCLIVGVVALWSAIAKAWRVTGTQYSLTPSRLILASRSLTGAFTVAVPLRADGTTAMGKDLFGHHVVLPAGEMMGMADVNGLTKAESETLLSHYESLREGLSRLPTDDEARA